MKQPDGTFSDGYPIARISVDKVRMEHDPDKDTYSMSRKVMVEFVKKQDDYLFERIFEFAKNEGISDLYLIDKDFVVSAFKHEMERRRMEQNK